MVRNTYTNWIFRLVETFSVSGVISKANESSTFVEWINKGFKKTNMGTPESTAQVHPRLLTRALLERAVASGKTKFVQGKNGNVLQAAPQLGSFMRIVYRYRQGGGAEWEQGLRGEGRRL